MPAELRSDTGLYKEDFVKLRAKIWADTIVAWSTAPNATKVAWYDEDELTAYV